MISRAVWIDPFGGRACGAPDEDDNGGGEMAHVQILAGAQPSEYATNNSVLVVHRVDRALVRPSAAASDR